MISLEMRKWRHFHVGSMTYDIFNTISTHSNSAVNLWVIVFHFCLVIVTYPYIWTMYRTYGTITGMLHLSRNLDPH